MQIEGMNYIDSKAKAFENEASFLDHVLDYIERIKDAD